MNELTQAVLDTRAAVEQAQQQCEHETRAPIIDSVRYAPSRIDYLAALAAHANATIARNRARLQEANP